MGIRILKAGLLTTVQDLGRSGYQSQGFGVSGVMDVRSFKIANLLIDNPENEAVLEFTLIGPTLEFTSASIIAITGGDFQPEVNGEPVPMYTALYMNKGDILKFGSARSGSRGYISFSHEFDQESVMLRVVMGPQNHMFSKQGIHNFLHEEYTVTSDFDRMGCRLEGPFIAPKTTSDIISEGIALGSIQVPSHGKPIILLADRQTTGGYAKIATVISVDIPKLVQRKTDHKIRFQEVSVEEAQRLYKEEEKSYMAMRAQIHKPCKEVLECRQVAKRLRRLFPD